LFVQGIRLARDEYLSRLDTSGFSIHAVNKILRYGAPVGAVFMHYRQLDRCMDYLQHMMLEAENRGEVLAAGTVIQADILTGSCGRFDRSWYAPEGGIWLAMAWPDTLLPEFSRLLPFAVGLACCRMIRSYQVDASLKWVNDILVTGKKIAGILCKTVSSPRGERYHLLGVGINVNNQVFPEELQDNAVGLAGLCGHALPLDECTGRLLAELNWTLGLLCYDEALALQEQESCKQTRLSSLLRGWQQYSDTRGQRVQYGFDVWKKPLYEAVVKGLDPCGGLILELQDGSTIIEYSGEIRYLC
jgi:BirA family biotin operon repressor/biotin-[acetyl-CoA-carboxylase] ligase